jgi:hypothetical protein
MDLLRRAGREYAVYATARRLIATGEIDAAAPTSNWTALPTVNEVIVLAAGAVRQLRVIEPVGRGLYRIVDSAD